MDNVEKKALHKKLKRYLVRKGMGGFIWYVNENDFAATMDIDVLLDGVVESIEDNLCGGKAWLEENL